MRQGVLSVIGIFRQLPVRPRLSKAGASRSDRSRIADHTPGIVLAVWQPARRNSTVRRASRESRNRHEGLKLRAGPVDLGPLPVHRGCIYWLAEQLGNLKLAMRVCQPAVLES